ncbi:GRP family sugar transporter [Parabacteroides pacaensis]|uniref:GRP family sugar transporter n=1 Tax=Parabacteroides pacaensis TaxID=2086575 RepID=UPI000D0FF23F|nr:GRP family sugar transporter [Parabacteroides pacaensis]
MDILDWLVACIPILSFGVLPVIATSIGGKPVEQSMGIAIGGMVFAIIVFLLKKPELTPHIFIISLLSGIFWAIGSVGQFMGLNYLGVARSIPISDGGQIIGTSLLGILLGEWVTFYSKIFGFSALILIIIGIILTSYKDEKKGESPQWKKGLLVNFISIIGFTLYVGILKYYKINGWSSILPQSFGQIVGILLISSIFFKMNPFSKCSFKSSILGIIWGVGNIALLLSQARIGLAVAYPISQASVIVSVLGGVFINKEYKNRKEWIYSAIGMLIILLGLLFLYFSTIYDK